MAALNIFLKKLILLSSLLIGTFPLKAFSQDAIIDTINDSSFRYLIFKGKVTNEYGEALPANANIQIPGTMRGTISDMNGDFILEAKAKETIKVSYIGRTSQLIQLQKKDTAGLHIILLEAPPQRLRDVTINGRQEVSFCPGEECFHTVEKAASFPGGEDSLKSYVQRAISYPEKALKQGEEGQVIIGFTIEKDGAICAPEIIKSVSPALDKEAMRILISMPHWHPAKQRNKPVTTRQELPVNFVINLYTRNSYYLSTP